jgi:hypothetical protein
MSWRKEVIIDVQDGVSIESMAALVASEIAADILLKVISAISYNKRKALREHSIDNYIPKNEQEMYSDRLRGTVFKRWFDKRDVKNVHVV